MIKTGTIKEPITPKLYAITTNDPKSISPLIDLYRERSLAVDNLPIEARKLRLFNRVSSELWNDSDSGYWIRIEARPVKTYDSAKVQASPLSTGIVRG